MASRRKTILVNANAVKNKLSQKTKMPLVLTDTPKKPFEKCALDIGSPITMEENKYILTLQDNLKLEFAERNSAKRHRSRIKRRQRICHKNNNGAWNTRKNPYGSRYQFHERNIYKYM